MCERKTSAFADKRTSALAAAVIAVCAIVFGLFAGELYFAAQKLGEQARGESCGVAQTEYGGLRESADILP